MSMLDPRVWIAALLAVLAAFGSGFYKGNATGKKSVNAEWTAEKLAQSEAARQREKAQTIANQGVDRELQADKKRRAAADLVTADSLLSFEAALAERNNASAASGTNGTGGLERELFGSCAKALVELGQTADRLEGKVIGLQAYVSKVCRPPSDSP